MKKLLRCVFVLAVAVALNPSIAALAQPAFELASEQVPWQQVEKRPSFLVFSEREKYESIDRVGRFVCAVQVGDGGPKLDELEVRWQVKK